MATHIILVNFTHQGILNVKQSPERAKSAFAAAEKLGIKVREAYWTMGAHDAIKASFNCILGGNRPVRACQDSTFYPIDMPLRTLLQGKAEK